jgi:transcriptional regulator with XRE-family HTH domain
MSNPLRAYRENRSLSQEVVAEMLGVSRQMVGMLEKGERNFTAEMAVKIEQRLGIDRVLVRPDIFRRKAA